MGVNPYPCETFEVNTSTGVIREHFLSRRGSFNVSLAGRIMSRRIMGVASFAEIQDSEGRIQIYVRRDDICPGDNKLLYNEIFKKKLDIGDIIGVKGHVFTTQTGEISIHVNHLEVLCKSLRPIPVVKSTRDEAGEVSKHDVFTSPEQRYRQRHVDMVVNPEVCEVFRTRATIYRIIRKDLDEKGYLEVETPVLQPVYGGASAKPFVTHHQALNRKLYLRIANELYLKRLLVGGLEGVYEFAKDFRNEGLSRYHNPEFTQLELYVAFKDYLWMMRTVEDLLEKVIMEIHKDLRINVGGKVLDFQRPWKRLTYFEALELYTGKDFSEMDDTALRTFVRENKIKLVGRQTRILVINKIFEHFCEPKLIQPTFITDFPIELSPLTKNHRENSSLAERFELICNGKELMNAYSELNDPVDQRARLVAQRELGKRGDEEAMVLDEDFIQALEYGMPPAAGVGIGMDRLAMLLTDQPSIQDVIFFPQMRQIQSVQASGKPADKSEVVQEVPAAKVTGL